MKSAYKKKAIKYRKRGLSYSEIKEIIPVSKSTLSLWLSHIQLNSKQKARLKDKIRAVQPFGAQAQKRIRIEKSEKIIKKAKRESGKMTNRDLFLLGVVLYWAEGSKQKKNNPSQRVIFNNSDPAMVKLYIKWLHRCLGVSKNDINFEIYSHSNIKDREKEIVRHWSLVTGSPVSKFNRIYYKKDKKRKYRKNQGKNYFGLLRVCVVKSTDLNREIAGWTLGICERCGVL